MSDYVKFRVDSVCVNGSYIAAVIGDELVVQDDNDQLWVLRHIDYLHVPDPEL